MNLASRFKPIAAILSIIVVAVNVKHCQGNAATAENNSASHNNSRFNWHVACVEADSVDCDEYARRLWPDSSTSGDVCCQLWTQYRCLTKANLMYCNRSACNAAETGNAKLVAELESDLCQEYRLSTMNRSCRIYPTWIEWIEAAAGILVLVFAICLCFKLQGIVKCGDHQRNYYDRI